MHHVTASHAPTWTDAAPAASRPPRSRAIRVLVLTGFGFAWAAAGLLKGDAPGWCWIVLLSIVVALASHGVQSLRRVAAAAEPLAAPEAERQRRAGRWLTWTSAIEGVAILLAVNIVANLGHPQWQTAAAMLVVGLHFLPLAFALESRAHVVTGVVLSAWALGYPWLFAAGAVSAAGPLGAGVVLLASAMVAQRRR